MPFDDGPKDDREVPEGFRESHIVGSLKAADEQELTDKLVSWVSVLAERERGGCVILIEIPEQ